MLRALLLAGLALGTSLPHSVAQTPPDTTIPGFSIDSSTPVGLLDAYATLPNGNRVVNDGLDISLVAPDGTVLALLASFPQFFFPSFVVVDPTQSFALVGESDRGKISRVDLAVGGRVVVADIDFNYDAAFETPTRVLVSANPGGFGFPNEIWRIDLASGVSTLVATFNGNSGPLAFAPNGDLYCAVIPGFPATTDLIRFTAAQIQSGAVLTLADATVFASGLQGASSMRFDPVYGRLFVAAAGFANPSALIGFHPDGSPASTVITTPNWISNVEFLAEGGPGAFHAFQPAGVRLTYRSTDWLAGVAQSCTVRPRRPQGVTFGPGLSGSGPVTFEVTGAHPNASFLVLLGFASAYGPEVPHDVGTYLFHTGMPIDQIRRLVYVPTDANGTGSWTFNNTPSLQGTRVLQALIRDPATLFVGSSTAAFN